MAIPIKPLLLSALLASAFVTARGADSPSVTGNWIVHHSIAGNESDMTCSLSQKDKDLTGTCKTDQGTGNLSGKVDDRKVSWTYKSEYNGGPITLTYAGSLDPTGKMSGTVKVEEYSVEGEFTATLSK